MIRIVTFLLAAIVSSSSAQSIFKGLGEGEKNKKAVSSIDALVVPQFKINYNTYSEVDLEEKESKISALRGNLKTVGTNQNYSRQSSLIKATSILKVDDLALADFEKLTVELQAIMTKELMAVGIKVLSPEEMQSLASYEKLAEKKSGKADKVADKAATKEVGEDKIEVLAKGGTIICSGDMNFCGFGPGMLPKIQKLQQESKASIMLQNLDIDFSSVIIEADVKAGVVKETQLNWPGTYKNTEAKSQVIPAMKVLNNQLVLVDNKGTPHVFELKNEFISDKPFNGKLYQDKKQSETMLNKMFSMKRKANVEFDPVIVEMNKEEYLSAAKHLFELYSKELAAAIVAARK